jgi:RND family efflux transporter MFP subunit
MFSTHRQKHAKKGSARRLEEVRRIGGQKRSVAGSWLPFLQGECMSKKGVVFVALCLTFVIALAGCKAKGQAKNVAEKSAVSVEVAKVTAADITEGVDVVGSMSAKFQADVRAEFAGAVSDVYVTEWVRVKKGTPLARQDTRELELMLQKGEAAIDGAKANVLQAEVGRNRAEREYARFVKMKEAGLVTQQNLDDVSTEREAASARVEAAKAVLNAAERELMQGKTHLSKGVIRSPLDGVISFRSVNPGDLVGDMGGQKVLFRVVDPRSLDLTVTAPSKEMASIHVGQPLVFTTDALPGKTFSGRVTTINPVVSDADRSIRVVAEVRNDSEELKPGLFANGRIVTGSRKGVLQVPRTGLLAWDVMKKQADVFVLSGDKVQKKTIQTGIVTTDLVEVASGLQGGDQVVTRGGFNLKDGDTVKVVQGDGR